MYIYKKRIMAFAMCLCVLLSLCSCSITKKAVNKAKSQISGSETTVSDTVRITFPEGISATEIAEKLEENGVCTAEEFLAEVNNTSYLEEYGIEIDDPDARPFLLEGYLFPDTYDFFFNEKPESVIKKFLRNFFNRITDDMIARADELGFTLDEMITLASVIQREGGLDSEMYKISSVIHNRLNSSEFPKIQCDATIDYLKLHVKPYVSEDKYPEYCEIYNTYSCEGLPEGPICSPGLDVIDAALYPDDTDYYYFLSDSDGVYHYSETQEQHNELCSQYNLNY